MSDTEDFDCSRISARSHSLMSEDGEEEAQSISLLAPQPGVGENGDIAPPNDGERQQNMIKAAVKRALEPVLAELKEVKKQNVSMDSKLTKVLHKNDSLEKVLKELVSKSQKGTDSLEVLLMADGLKMLKSICFKNLDMGAKDPEEIELLNRFMEKAKEEGWLQKTSGKAEVDIIQGYRKKRNYLKAQIRIRVFADMTNKSADEASELVSSMKFLRETLGMTELLDDHLRILYNFAYTHLKYLNAKTVTATMSQVDKKNRRTAKEDVWSYVMQRVVADRSAKRSHTVTKDRFLTMLQAGQEYEPLDF